MSGINMGNMYCQESFEGNMDPSDMCVGNMIARETHINVTLVLANLITHKAAH